MDKELRNSVEKIEDVLHEILQQNNKAREGDFESLDTIGRLCYIGLKEARSILDEEN